MSWLQPWTDEGAVGLDDGSLSNPNVDASALPFDLEELFGSTENYLHAPLYDEMMFGMSTRSESFICIALLSADHLLFTDCSSRAHAHHPPRNTGDGNNT